MLINKRDYFSRINEKQIWEVAQVSSYLPNFIKFLFDGQVLTTHVIANQRAVLQWQSVLLIKIFCNCNTFGVRFATSRFALPVCGARQKHRPTKQSRFLPTAAHAAQSLLPPLAALRLAARKDVVVRWLIA